MIDPIVDRKSVIEFIKKELVGPCPLGEELNCGEPLKFDEAKEAYKPRKQAGSGDEILQVDAPTRRYGIGVLYPRGLNHDENSDAPANPPPFAQPRTGEEVGETAELDETLEELKSESEAVSDGENTEDLDLSLANVFKPSSMGITFFVEKAKDFKLCVNLKGGRYAPLPVEIGGRAREWWRRSEISIDAVFDGNDLSRFSRGKLAPVEINRINCDSLNLSIELFVHEDKKKEQGKLVTLYVTNGTMEYRS
ncbi:MAG: hypothetical protein V1882_01165, partial [Candidatus Omnitrophota bacterium]